MSKLRCGPMSVLSSIRALGPMAVFGALFAAGFLGLAGCGAPIVQPPPKVPEPASEAPWPDRPAVQGKVAAQFPAVATQGVRRTPGGGVELLTVVRDDQPIVHLRWILPGGRSHEWTPKGFRWPEGTVGMAAQLLTKGTKRHPGGGWVQATEALGGQLQIAAAADAIVVEGQVLSHNLVPFLGLVAEALLEPQFDAATITSLRQQLAAELRAEQGDAEALAHNLARQLVFGQGHPYASKGATLASLAKIQKKQLVEAWQASARLGGSTLVAVGDLRPEELAKSLDGIFGAALERPNTPPSVPLPRAATGDTCHIIDVPAAAQVVLVQVAPGPPRRSRIWPQLTVANQVLGGSASSRLFSDLREKRGWTYGIYSGLEGRRQAGRWMIEASLKPEVVGEALGVLEDHILQLRRVAATPAELSAATRYLAGQFALSLASSDQVAEYLAAAAIYDLPGDYWKLYPELLQDASAEQVLEAAVQAIPAAGRITVAAGPLALVRPSIDGACRTLQQHSAQGVAGPLLIGPDAAMSDEARKKAFEAWQRGPGGLVAAEHYAAEVERNSGFRAQALAAVARGESFAKVSATGRKAADWKDNLAPALAKLLLGALHDPNPQVQHRAHAVLLQLAVPATGAEADVDPDTAGQLLAAVAEWAFAGVTPGRPAAEIRQLAESRLDEGDVLKLGEVASEPLQEWIAADVRRHEAAAALLAAKTPQAAAALVKGYRRLNAAGPRIDPRDLQALGQVGSIDAAVLLLDLHAVLAPLDQADAVTATAALMTTARQVVAGLAAAQPEGEVAEGSAITSALGQRFDRIESHLDGLLALRNADDRWWAASLLVEHRRVAGLRRVLAGLASDDHYRQPRWHTVDPKLAMAQLAGEPIATLRLDAEPALLAALSGRSAIGKVLAVAGLKALGTEGALSALRTATDSTEVSELIDAPQRLTVRDLALAAIDVYRFYTEVEAEFAAGRLTRATANRYRESAYLTMGLTGRQLRQAVVDAVAQQPAESAAEPAAAATPTTGKGELQ